MRGLVYLICFNHCQLSLRLLSLPFSFLSLIRVLLQGGTCQTTVMEGADGEQTETRYCDCATAFTDDDIFAGEFCEHKATSFCTIPTGDTLEGVLFCTNGGTCRMNHLEGCECDAAWEGLSCEFATDTSSFVDDNDEADNDQFLTDAGDDDPFSCDLPCHNGGICAHGAKDLGHFADVIGDVSHLNATFHADQFAHCVCPPGFVGLLCEYQVETCGEHEHYCLHGSKCVEKNGKKECDCSQADETVGSLDGRPFAGDSCEHVATDICNIGGTSYPGQPLYFCTNGGICNAYVENGLENPGCKCTAEWTGPHCEVSIASFQARASTASRDDVSSIIWIVAVVLVIVLAVLVVGKRLISVKRPNHPSDDEILEKTIPHAFPRRRRRAGFNGSMNLAPAHRSSLADSPPRTSNSDAIVPAAAAPEKLGENDNETDTFHDEPDGILTEGETDIDRHHSDGPIMGGKSGQKNEEFVDFV